VQIEEALLGAPANLPVLTGKWICLDVMRIHLREKTATSPLDFLQTPYSDFAE